MRKSQKDVLKNIVYAFSAQIISLLLSVIMSLLIPRVLGIEEFSYWQLFLFYTGFLGIFHFGLNDGIYLRLGGEGYKSLNFSLIGSQLRVSLIFQCLLAFAIILISFVLVDNRSRLLVCIGAAIYLPIYNTTTFIEFVFQAVNKIKLYSLIFTIDRLFLILAISVLLVLQCDTFYWFIIVYIIGKLVALVCGIWSGRDIIFAESLPIKEVSREMQANISVGIKLMLSNISSILILGSGRFIVDHIWGITAFGKFSFAISLTSFFLLFITQISIVLFPILRQSDGKNLKKFYCFSRDLLGILLTGILLAYMPIKYCLGLWLPQYSESLQYLALLIPLCIYDGKMNVLCSTYFKVWRKEGLLLKINLVSLGISLFLGLIGGYLIHNIYTVIIAMLIAVAFRSVVSEIYLAKFMEATITKSLIAEFVLIVIFITCTWFLSTSDGFMAYLIAYATYIMLFKDKLITIAHLTRSYLKS